MFEISRSPAREALALLQIEGLVRVLPKRGTFVFTPDEKVVGALNPNKIEPYWCRKASIGSSLAARRAGK